ncbi:hypothetical protein [uncultured Ruminococcus sp.]|uniref:hypothetical protein n=1 Tax=uncultured Ruminococcus sp. TaxID=165186 RepID=UPI002674FBA1|nr:hypothetical protein [uncultured Ruminococcus sp.]
MKYDGKFASRWRAKSPDALCAVLPLEQSRKNIPAVLFPDSAAGMLFFRTCLHKKYMWIFEHNFVADKAKIRRRAVARQVFFTQYATKFAEKT